MAEESQQNKSNNQPSDLSRIDGSYDHIFLLLKGILPPTSIYYSLVSAYELLMTLPLPILPPTSIYYRLLCTYEFLTTLPLAICHQQAFITVW